jgi:hypothetical protein
MKIIEGRGRVIVNRLPSTDEVSIMVDSGRGSMGAILTTKQALELKRAIFDCVYSEKQAELPAYPECD